MTGPRAPAAAVRAVVLAHQSEASSYAFLKRSSASCLAGSRKDLAKAPKSLLSASAGSVGRWVCAATNLRTPQRSGGASAPSFAMLLRISSQRACAAWYTAKRSSTSASTSALRLMMARVRPVMTCVACRAPPHCSTTFCAPSMSSAFSRREAEVSVRSFSVFRSSASSSSCAFASSAAAAWAASGPSACVAGAAAAWRSSEGAPAAPAAGTSASSFLPMRRSLRMVSSIFMVFFSACVGLPTGEAEVSSFANSSTCGGGSSSQPTSRGCTRGLGTSKGSFHGRGGFRPTHESGLKSGYWIPIWSTDLRVPRFK
mmetsp:Transcript_87605/g.283624  ORF Transcript_87605/g.283624 Transcript_87605/m.283624 type:complete len:314 (+) Transcript_87605:446-1387(+)